MQSYGFCYGGEGLLLLRVVGSRRFPDWETSMMSSTYYAVHSAKFDAELEKARIAGDLPRMQVALSGLDALRRAITERRQA
jgi:hypothetical protein